MNDDKFNIQSKEKSQNKDKKCCGQDCGCHDKNDEGDLWVWVVIFILCVTAAMILF